MREDFLKDLRAVLTPERYLLEVVVEHRDRSLLKTPRYLFNVAPLFPGKGQSHLILHVPQSFRCATQNASLA